MGMTYISMALVPYAQKLWEFLIGFWIIVINKLCERHFLFDKIIFTD